MQAQAFDFQSRIAVPALCGENLAIRNDVGQKRQVHVALAHDGVCGDRPWNADAFIVPPYTAFMGGTIGRRDVVDDGAVVFVWKA